MWNACLCKLSGKRNSSRSWPWMTLRFQFKVCADCAHIHNVTHQADVQTHQDAWTKSRNAHESCDMTHEPEVKFRKTLIEADSI